MNALAPDIEHTPSTSSSEFLTFMIEGQRFGIPILQVQDVLGRQKVTRVPLAPPEVVGSLNLRGRIVTAINVKKRLGIEGSSDHDDNYMDMSVVVEHDHELYSLVIDSVSDVMRFEKREIEATPPTLDSVWRDISDGIFRLDKELLIILNIEKLIESVQS